VNNNAYTNLMARENLHYAAETVASLRTTDADAYNALVHKTRLEPAEIEAWKRAAEAMYVPYDEKLNIIPRDGGGEAQLLGRAARTKVAADRGAALLA
jgi:alpha,alpha-trehalose phosphorylase